MHSRCLSIPADVKQTLRILFVAKHALGDGSPDAADGTHATYHHEFLMTLRAIGLQVKPCASFEPLFDPREVDFVISLYNRAGFRNSEMLAPLLAERAGLPVFGGSAIVRGLTDDKHWMKRIAKSLGVRTPDWCYYPIGGLNRAAPAFAAEAFVVKPNASSASWGILLTDQWSTAWQHVEALHAAGHDVIVESWIDGSDVADPVVGSGSPWFLPVIEYEYEGKLRTYEQKRDLVSSTTHHQPVTDRRLFDEVRAASSRIVREVWPFDHGRLEYRIERSTGRVFFIEININCNLWSKKTISNAARMVGVSHQELVETVVCHSLMRQGLVGESRRMVA
jgi:D-alanine-D-alanine ligase